MLPKGYYLKIRNPQITDEEINEYYSLCVGEKSDNKRRTELEEKIFINNDEKILEK